MEGELHKWTNYWNGWQSRWFILSEGILSYYGSLEEVDRGSCKGSINVAAAEIALHPTDPLRLDLTIPGEQHIYVRANSEKCRQEWLIALGSAKACCLGGGGHALNSVHAADGEGDSWSKGCVGSSASMTNQLKVKKSELRLYCDVLMQQVFKVKETMESSQSDIDIQKLDEGSSSLVHTCDTFIATLDEVMHLVQAAGEVAPGRKLSRATSNAPGSIPVQPAHTHTSRSTRSRTVSTDSVLSGLSNLSVDNSHGQPGVNCESHPGGFNSLFGSHNQPSDGCGLIASNLDSSSDLESPSRQRLHPNSSARSISSSDESCMTQVLDSFPFKKDFPPLSVRAGKSFIPTQEFLQASTGAISLFDYLDSKAFAPIKLDIAGNISCLSTKYLADPQRFICIEAMVEQELDENLAKSLNSATTSLLWLTRGLSFINKFFQLFLKKQTWTVEKCLTEAYEETLKRYHGLVVRSVFSVAIKHSPTRTKFLESLNSPGTSSLPSSDSDSTQVKSLSLYISTLEKCLDTLRSFLQEQKIEE